MKNRCATLAQLVERLIRNQQVAGSIPAGGSSLNSRVYEPARCGLSRFCQPFCQPELLAPKQIRRENCRGLKHDLTVLWRTWRRSDALDWMPGASDGFELSREAKRIGVLMARGKDGEHSHHVGGDWRVHSPELGQIEAATFFGIPPGLQEIRNSTALSGVAFRDLNQATNRSSDVLRDRDHHVLTRPPSALFGSALGAACFSEQAASPFSRPNRGRYPRTGAHRYP
jgi:hypothetical protein